MNKQAVSKAYVTAAGRDGDLYLFQVEVPYDFTTMLYISERELIAHRGSLKDLASKLALEEIERAGLSVDRVIVADRD